MATVNAPGEKPGAFLFSHLARKRKVRSFPGMRSTLTDLHRATKQVMRPVLSGETVQLTEHGKPVARIAPDYPTVTMTAAEFRALDIPGDELDQAINQTLAEIRA